MLRRSLILATALIGAWGLSACTGPYEQHYFVQLRVNESDLKGPAKKVYALAGVLRNIPTLWDMSEQVVAHCQYVEMQKISDHYFAKAHLRAWRDEQGMKYDQELVIQYWVEYADGTKDRTSYLSIPKGNEIVLNSQREGPTWQQVQSDFDRVADAPGVGYLKWQLRTN